MEDTRKNLVDALSQFISGIIPHKYKFIRTTTGVNNHVYYIYFDDEIVAVLRIYNNGDDIVKVTFEHEILRQLREIDLPFSIPNPFKTLRTNEPFAVILPNKTIVSVFTLIPGQNPKLTNVFEVGRACGSLNSALLKIDLDPSKGSRFPYYMLYHAHSSIGTKEMFLSQLKEETLQRGSEHMSELLIWLQCVEVKIPELLQLGLPRQWIHGDLNYDNVLCEGGVVTGIVDFEFGAFDWRAMELATALSKYAAELDPLPYVRPFIQGYCSTAVPLTSTEASVLPDLIMLRILSMSVYFVGRAVSGEGSWETFLARLPNYCHRLRWVQAHRELLEQLLRSESASCTANTANTATATNNNAPMELCK